MPKKTKSPELVAKLVKFPADWIERIDQARGKQSFSDFVRDAVAEKVGRRGLSEVPQWGQGRPPKQAKKGARKT